MPAPPRPFLRVLLPVAAALLAALGVMLWQAPASYLSSALSRASGGRVELGEVEGTVWRGQGALLLDPGGGHAGGRTRLPGTTRWRVAALPLLFGNLHVELANPAVLEAPLDLHLDRARNGSLEADRLRLPAEALVGLGAPWNTVEPGGQLTLEWDTLRLSAGELRGGLRLQWDGASSRLSPVVPFGSYRVECDGVFPGAQLSLRTLAGPMEMNGDGTIDADHRLQFRGTARVRPGTDAATATQLAGLITLLGPRDGDAAVLNFGI
jgi:general secretion pathway protein N